MPIHPSNRKCRDFILAAPYGICIERARHYTESYKRTEGEHPDFRAAAAFAHTLESMTVWIGHGELIAGDRSSKPLGVVLPVERGDVNSILELDLDSLASRKRQTFHIEVRCRTKLCVRL